MISPDVLKFEIFSTYLKLKQLLFQSKWKFLLLMKKIIIHPDHVLKEDCWRFNDWCKVSTNWAKCGEKSSLPIEISIQASAASAGHKPYFNDAESRNSETIESCHELPLSSCKESQTTATIASLPTSSDSTQESLVLSPYYEIRNFLDRKATAVEEPFILRNRWQPQNGFQWPFSLKKIGEWYSQKESAWESYCEVSQLCI